MNERIAFTPLDAADRESIARLLHGALVHWYESHLLFPTFMPETA